MIQEIDNISWGNTVKENKFSVFFNPDYLDAVSQAFDIKIIYFNYLEKDTLHFLAAVFTKNNKIIIPDNFTYNPYYLNPAISERKKIATHKQFIEILKSKYKSIAIKFNVDVLDIRPYKWAGFNVDVRYTYIKNTSEPSHYSIEKNLRRVSKTDIEVRVNVIKPEVIDLNVDFFKTLGYTNAVRLQYKELLTTWGEFNLLYSFEVYKSNILIGSNLILLDKSHFKAFTLVLNPVSHQYKYAHTLLYQTAINWLRDNNFIEVDFCGANFESISNFKSFFNPILKPYYVVSYKKSGFGLKIYLLKIYNKLKQFLKV